MRRFVFLMLVLLIGCEGISLGPPHKAKATDGKPGEKVELRMGGAGYVFVHRSYGLARGELEDGPAAGQHQHAEKLEKDGVVYVCDAGVMVKILKPAEEDHDHRIRRVKILDGKHKGKVGWTTYKYVRYPEKKDEKKAP